MSCRISVFYHLFAVRDWRRIFDVHMEQLRRSGLYDACEQIRIGVVYPKAKHLECVRRAINGSKAKLSYCRRLSDPPLIWRNPRIYLKDGRFGEAETILHMTRLAQDEDEGVIYLFMHTKGVTGPETTKRRDFDYLVGRGLNPAASDDAANDFVLHDLASVVQSWRTHCAALEKASFSYRRCNFFWVAGQLLHRFDFAGYLNAHAHQAPPQQRGHRLGVHWNTSRHIFSLSPSSSTRS